MFDFFKKKPAPPKVLSLSQALEKVPFLTEEWVKDFVNSQTKVIYDLPTETKQIPLTLVDFLTQIEKQVASFFDAESKDGKKEYTHVFHTIAEMLEGTLFISSGQTKKLNQFLDVIKKEEQESLKRCPDYQVIKGYWTLGQQRTKAGEFCAEVYIRFSNFFGDTEKAANDHLKYLLTEQVKMIDKPMESGLFSPEEIKKAIQEQADLLDEIRKKKKEILEALDKKGISEKQLKLTNEYCTFFCTLYGFMNTIINKLDNNIVISPAPLNKTAKVKSQKEILQKDIKKMDASFFRGVVDTSESYSEDNKPFITIFSNNVYRLYRKTLDMIKNYAEGSKEWNWFVRIAILLDEFEKRRPKVDSHDVEQSQKSRAELKRILKNSSIQIQTPTPSPNQTPTSSPCVSPRERDFSSSGSSSPMRNSK